MDRVPSVTARLRTRALVAAGLGLTLAAGLAPAAGAADTDRDSSDWPSIAATPVSSADSDAATVAVLRAGLGLRRLDTEFLVWDEHVDPVGDSTLVPELTGAFMGVPADDPTTQDDESSLLLIGAVTSGPTVDTDFAIATLDLDGDSVDDLGVPTPDGPIPFDEAVASTIWTFDSGSWEDTGVPCAWMRETDGYIVGFDYRSIGLTAARFTFGLADSDVVAVDWAPDNYTGAAVELPTTPPTSPRNVQAVAGDRAAQVSWSAPADAGSTPVTGYIVTSYPDGRSCTTSGLTCVVTGLTNQQSYTFGVVAVSASGTSAPTTSDAVIPQPFTKVIVRAKRSGRVLHVNVNPNLTGSKYWRFRVIRITAKGTWVSKRAFRTRGAGETRTIDMPKGRYWVVVLPKYGYQATVSRAVTLRR